jgi:hypothetical protein
MNSILEAIASVGAVVAGLALRLGVVMAVMLTLALAFQAAVSTAHGFRTMWLWARGGRATGALH